MASSLPTTKPSNELEMRHSEARQKFALQSIQFMNPEMVLKCQKLIGHGQTFGIWETPKNWAARVADCMREVDIRQRVLHFLPENQKVLSKNAIEPPPQYRSAKQHKIVSLFDFATLQITRYCLLCSLGPAFIGRRTKGRSLKPKTVSQLIYQYLPPLAAQGLSRHLSDSEIIHPNHLFRDIQKDELGKLTDDQCRAANLELTRMAVFQEQDLWHDVPAHQSCADQTTSIKGERAQPKEEQKTKQYQPLPDDYVGEMGKRVLWIVNELGPNLIHLLENLPDLFSAPNTGSVSKFRKRQIAYYFDSTPWKERSGMVDLVPSFKLRHFARGRTKLVEKRSNEYEWPPHNWLQIRSLLGTLQAAHLWVMLLAMGGRHGEVMSLERHCIEFSKDGTPFANGKTYKLSETPTGDKREWVLPDIAVDVLAQQVRLLDGWARVAPLFRSEGEEDSPKFSADYLWAGHEHAFRNVPDKALKLAYSALLALAKNIGMTEKPGGINLHPHRFRKTIARLCGIALVNSPKILMQVFGHKNIEMTLYYILTDKALAKEVEQVAREIRIMRCEQIISDIHDAGTQEHALQYGGHGGGGAEALARTIKNHEQQLHKTGQEWGSDSAHDLAVILTMNGQTWSYVRPDVLCTKGIGEYGECIKHMGNPDASNCQSSCVNRIEEKTARRDIESIMPILLGNLQQAQADNDLMLAASLAEQIRYHASRFSDLFKKFQRNPTLSEILTTP